MGRKYFLIHCFNSSLLLHRFLNLNYHILFTCMNLFHNLFGKSTNLCHTYISTNAFFKLPMVHHQHRNLNEFSTKRFLENLKLYPWKPQIKETNVAMFSEPWFESDWCKGGLKISVMSVSEGRRRTALLKHHENQNEKHWTWVTSGNHFTP